MTTCIYFAGPCRSYEYQCHNFRCIISDLVCNGHNPCGDNSDCQVSSPPIDVTSVEGKDPVLLASVIGLGATVVILIVVTVAAKCFHNRRKHHVCKTHNLFVI